MATIKITLLESCAGNDYSYGKGGTYDAPEERAKDLIKGGLAIPAGPPIKAETATAKQAKETRKK